MKEIHQEFLTGERALFQAADMKIYDTIFDDGESPLKHSKNIELYRQCEKSIQRSYQDEVDRQAYHGKRLSRYVKNGDNL